MWWPQIIKWNKVRFSSLLISGSQLYILNNCPLSCQFTSVRITSRFLPLLCQNKGDGNSRLTTWILSKFRINTDRWYSQALEFKGSVLEYQFFHLLAVLSFTKLLRLLWVSMFLICKVGILTVPHLHLRGLFAVPASPPTTYWTKTKLPFRLF